MPIISDVLQPQGALVDIQVGMSAASALALRLALRSVPSPVSARAVLDSGAEITCVDQKIIQSLGLPWGGATLINLPAHGGLTISAQHDVSLIIVHPSSNAAANLVIRNLAVLEVQLAALGYEALIGRDILANCRFLYDGPRQRFRLRY